MLFLHLLSRKRLGHSRVGQYAVGAVNFERDANGGATLMKMHMIAGIATNLPLRRITDLSK